MKKISIKFASDEKAERFAGDLSFLGESVSVDGSIVSVRTDSENVARIFENMRDEMRSRMIANGMLEAIVECLTDRNLKQITFMDGTTGRMTRNYAKLMSRVHDRLDESNRTAFLILASQDKQSFEKAVEFSKNNEEESA